MQQNTVNLATELLAESNF